MEGGIIYNEGYSCGLCGAWIPAGTTHFCSGFGNLNLQPCYYPFCQTCIFAPQCKKAILPICFEKKE